jgi:hypothetical protein
MRLAVLLLLSLVGCSAVGAPTPAPVSSPLFSLTIGKKGLGDLCVSGAKAPGVKLLFRAEVWSRKNVLVATVEVPDADSRPLFAQCRPLVGAPGELLKVFSVGPAPKSLTVNPRPSAQE